jgi:hypothetical protein
MRTGRALAHREGLNPGRSRVRTFAVLPDGYHTESDADVLTLLRADGSALARFSVRGVVWEAVERAATEDAVNGLHKRLRRAPARHPRRPVLPRHD